jgi:riboflavin biosynthesis pyrimidine reductase
VTTVDSLLAEDPALTGLAANGVTALHVEAPPAALDDLASRGLLDRAVIFVTPLLGGDPREAAHRESRVPGRAAACAQTLHAVTYERLGDTVLVTGYLPGSAEPTVAVPTAAP